MVWLCLALIPLSMLIAAPVTATVIRASRRLGAFDSQGVAGQVKAAPRRVPNTGGVAIVAAIVAPMLLLLWNIGELDVDSAPWLHDFSLLPTDLHEHLRGIQEQTPQAYLLVGCVLFLHVLGLVDDRRPLGPFLKLGLMTLPALAIPLVTTLSATMSPTRLLTLLDGPAGGPWASIALTTLWFLVVTNAMNFMDNMDGLAAGVSATGGALFLAAALARPQPQWFIGALLALLIGACLGFLWFNAPRRGGALIFMGDGGSLVLGFLLAFLTTRTTYLPQGGAGPSSQWYAVLMPLVVLAVPLYDFTSVVLIRLSQGRSPFVGDLQHLSHRLVRRGLSRRGAVVIIWALTGITGVSGVLLVWATPWQAALIGAQTAALLGVIAMLEWLGAGSAPA